MSGYDELMQAKRRRLEAYSRSGSILGHKRGDVVTVQGHTSRPEWNGKKILVSHVHGSIGSILGKWIKKNGDLSKHDATIHSKFLKSE